MMSSSTEVLTPAERVHLAREASMVLGQTSLTQRNAWLAELHRVYQAHEQEIKEANQKDMEEHPHPRLDMMGAQGEKFRSSLDGLLQLIKLPDPLNQVTLATQLDTDFTLYRRTCPLGVLFVVFEARPEVYLHLVALAVKSGNAVVLKGGHEATHTLQRLHTLTQPVLPTHAVHLVQTRADMLTYLALPTLDVVIARGSASLVHAVRQAAVAPVWAHAHGVCHVYVHHDAPLASTLAVCLDAKCTMPTACNAVETVLVHRGWPHLGALVDALVAAGVHVYTDMVMGPHVAPLDPDVHFGHEFGAMAVVVHGVESLHAALAHLARYGSQHTECILTEKKQVAARFLQRVDAACVFWNCSTRFSDGYRFGFGAEVGISTQRLHARGPVGLDGLVTYKYVVHGGDHPTVQPYVDGTKTFLHAKLPLTYPKDMEVTEPTTDAE